MSEKIRAEFEAWVKSRGGDAMKRDGEYVSSMTREWFKSWTASRQALVVELPQEKCDAGERLMSQVRDELDKAGVSYK